jgi:N-succinyldiaminopimelate aminotransferase
VRSRLPTTPTVFAVMSALAAETEAINLGQGYPDVDGPPAMLEAAVAAIRGGRNQYPPGIGVPELRAAVVAHQERHYGLTPDPDTGVLVTTGATEAITAAVLGLTAPGEEVLALEPWFDSYPAAAALAGCRLVPVPLSPPTFRLDVDRLRDAVTPNTRLLVLNSPHNPTGLVLSRDELTAVADVCREHDLLVVADEVYEHLVYDGVEHVPIATLPGMWERTVTVGSAGKQFSVTGWKVGWATGPAELVAAVRAVKQYLTYVSAGPLQPAVALALDTEDGWVAAQTERMQWQRDVLVSGLRALGLETFDSAGTYFAMSDVASWGFDDATSFATSLPRSAGVATIPCTPFMADPTRARTLVRWTFSKQVPVLEEALHRLARAGLGRG